MTKVYADTNRFIDFYQAANDKLDVFDELHKYKENLVLTEQTVAEFKRNRVATLRWLATQFKKSVDIPRPYTTSILRVLPDHKQLTDLWKGYKAKGEEIMDHLENLIEDEGLDPVAQKFLSLARDVQPLVITPQAIASAQRRKILGNPPCSPDKYSAGDEVIWETLLSGISEDLVLVTRDKTFHDNVSLLGEEFALRTGHKLLLITDKFSLGLEKSGQQPSDNLVKLEKQEQRLPRRDVGLPSADQRYAMLEREICPSCGMAGAMYGFDGSDGDSADWFECSSCAYIHMF